MRRASPTHVLFDFFGTLVTYSESRVAQGYPQSHALLVRAGARLDYASFLECWDAHYAEFESAAVRTLDEYTMDQVCAAFLRASLPEPPSDEAVVRFRD